MTNKHNTIAIVGATGAVGKEFISIIQQRGWHDKRYVMLASARSAGQKVRMLGQEHVVRELTADSFAGIDIALFSAGGGTSRQFAPAAVKAGAVVVDNSSAFRMDPGVPLVVPEINPQDAFEHHGIIANPNCSTIICITAIWPLHGVNQVRRMVISTYQAVSGAGMRAMQELETQSRDVLAGKPARPELFPFPCAFNLFSHNSPIDDTGYNEEERKLVRETRKIFHDDGIQISATCVRVPVMRAHSESVNLTFEQPITPAEVRDILSAAPGVRLVDQVEPQHFPMPIEASGIDDILVGRIRQDISQPDRRGIDLFLSGDQLRKGAALNAIQIAELLMNAN
ncbi:MAG: aspartate-semialdehyde dehydrogenase [Phycisphaerae bacterium]|nr:aspartate-semialdehyde dehydrogenase [Phycisphaerae bacterium]